MYNENALVRYEDSKVDGGRRCCEDVQPGEAAEQQRAPRPDAERARLELLGRQHSLHLLQGQTGRQLVCVRHAGRVKGAVLGTEREPGDVDQAEGGPRHGCDRRLPWSRVEMKAISSICLDFEYVPHSLYIHSYKHFELVYEVSL